MDEKRFDMSFKNDPKGYIAELIKDFVLHSSENNLAGQTPEKAFDEPLVGFAAGDDQIFESYKEHVGPFHWTPLEAFNQAFPDVAAEAGELTVIAWVLPQTKATKADNRKEKNFPAQRWARARIFGEEFNVKLRRRVEEALSNLDAKAVAPMLSPQWEKKASDAFVFASTWSERHAAYASGLGTFGLCDGLITPKGKAMRVGSAVVNIKMEPTPRPYEYHRQNCLFYTHNVCGKCIDRCPVGALSEKGHDKVKCREFLRTETTKYVESNFHFKGHGCGLCQTGVPCESKIPLSSEG